MAVIDLWGSGNQAINWPGLEFPRFDSYTISYSDNARISGSGSFWQGSLYLSGTFDYYGSFSSDSNGLFYGTLSGLNQSVSDGANTYGSEITGIYLPTDTLVAVNNADSALAMEASLLTGDDTLLGSTQGGSVSARLMGGNDTLKLYGGSENDVNTNWGSDNILLYGGGGRVRAGKDSDTIVIYGGKYEPVNGNNGNDVITNYSDDAGVVRGGADDDIIIAAGGSMVAYGDLGRDTFVPTENSVCVVADYVSGYDSVDFSQMSSYTLGSWSGGDGLMVYNSWGGPVMFLSGAYSL